MCAIEDVFARYHRMIGDETLWIPGTDHAGISTQVVVEKKLAKEGKNRQQMGRAAFLEEAYKWKEQSAGTIQKQIRQMGASLSWDHEKFTLEPQMNELVESVFVELYNRGLIYRGEYMVNYDPTLESVVSDEEVEYREEMGNMYYIAYFVAGSDNEFIVATTRPETLLADQAVAVHPKDRRFKKLIGKKVILPILNKEIPIIGDEMVDREFGTGVVKITPAHDPADFECGKRHGLRLDMSVIDKKGVMTKSSGIFAGQDVLTARENIVELLKAKGNLIKIEPHKQRVAYSERTGARIETVVTTQWFVKASVMAKKVIHGYKKKEFEIVPKRFNKTFEDWIYNLHDWCISRQLWWWHQIPAYYDSETGELLGVTQDIKTIQDKYPDRKISRDEDVLDTWFSSGLWPMWVLDWTLENEGELFRKFYPTQVLETGYDIIFFWVIRMLLMGYELTGQTPFKQIYFHGLVLDEHGQKMSKSKWNGIDPITVIEQYSADALRLALLSGNTPGNNMNFSIKLVENHSLFLNKLWNIVRFVHGQIGMSATSYSDDVVYVQEHKDELATNERALLSKLNTLIGESRKSFEDMMVSDTIGSLITFVRDEFADIYLEEYKLTKDGNHSGERVLSYAIKTLLKLLHPYVPMVTEELWSHISSEWYLMLSEFPEVIIERLKIDESDLVVVHSVIKAIRSIRSDKQIKPSSTLPLIICAPKKYRDILDRNKAIVLGLSKSASLEYRSDMEADQYWIYGVVKEIDIFVNVEGHTAITVAGEVERIQKEIEDKKDYLRRIDTKLLNESFVKNAPENLVRSEQNKKREALEQLQKLEELLKKTK